MKESFLYHPIDGFCTGEIEPLFVGYEKCEKGHSFGPYVRPCFLIHFCLSGKGCLQDKYGEHIISQGEMFVIRPGEVTVYTADEADPWEYCWIGFSGEKADVFFTERSVYPIPPSFAARLLERIRQGEDRAEGYLPFLFELIYALFCKQKNTVSSDARIANARQYIDHNYMYPIRVDEIARELGFERSYLYRLFKKQFGIGVKDYITQVRMEHARALLATGYTVGQVARMVGFEDLFHFSRSFKSYFGVSPSKRK